MRQNRPLLVVFLACLAWDLDCFDQQIFVMSRKSAIEELLPRSIELPDASFERFRAHKLEKSNAEGKPIPDERELLDAFTESIRRDAVGRATMLFLFGWGTGGLISGFLSDRYGRVKTLGTSVILYAAFTGANALANDVTIYCLFRFLAGLGIGGVFASAVSLIAETLSDRLRPYALGLLQASTVFGNCAAALLWMQLGHAGVLSLFGISITPWRLILLIGSVPGLLGVVILLLLREPERWQAIQTARSQPISARELLSDRQFLRTTFFATILAASGVVGMWGIAFFTPELTGAVIEAEIQQVSPSDVAAYRQQSRAYWSGTAMLALNGGAFLGMFAFSLVTQRLGRRPTFALFFILAAGTTSLVFLKFRQTSDIYWMMPLMGFSQLALFGGYAIYLPELFPTRVRGSGTSISYNFGRIVAAFGPYLFGQLTTSVFAQLPSPGPYRYAGVTMCSVFLLGLAVLPFLPETRKSSLPE